MEWTVEYAQGRALTVRRFGAGPELVWIHGLGEWSVSFEPVVAHAKLAGYRHTLIWALEHPVLIIVTLFATLALNVGDDSR